MIAEKQAAQVFFGNQVTEAKAGAQATSIRAPFEVIEKIADLSRPLRRPARRTPSRDVEEQAGLDDMEPRGDTLDALVDEFPAPQEWFDE